MLETINISAIRGERLLFKNLSFDLSPKELLLVRGRNGSGKTTLLRLLCGLAVPESGEILWAGEPIETVRPEYFASLIYIGHDNGINLELTVGENLEFHQVLKSSPSGLSIMDILGYLGIEQYADVPCRFLSAGQKRRVALARLAISKAKLWLLDEPFTALDDEIMAIAVQILARHLTRGGLCIATSHQVIDWQGVAVREISLT